MSEVTWFRPSERGVRVLGDTSFKLTFTEKPKGARFNAVMSRRLRKQNVKYLEVGVAGEGVLTVKPSYTKEGSFAAAGPQSGVQIVSADLYRWARDHGLMNKRIIGDYNDESGAYEFDVNQSEDDDVNENAVEAESVDIKEQ